MPSGSDPNDFFDFDGSPLVTNPGASTPTRTRYHTFSETFARILHVVEGGQDYWELTRPDGTVLRFGIDSSSKVLRDGASGPIMRWLIREMESTDGNVVLFDHPARPWAPSARLNSSTRRAPIPTSRSR
jgi:hypothetical protein